MNTNKQYKSNEQEQQDELKKKKKKKKKKLTDQDRKTINNICTRRTNAKIEDANRCTYYPNKQLKSKEYYKTNGVLHGQCHYYDPLGRKTKYAEYKEGKLNGDLKEYINGKIHTKSFYINDLLINITEYENNQPVSKKKVNDIPTFNKNTFNNKGKKNVKKTIQKTNKTKSNIRTNTKK